jgi:type IV pilus assembly protein PilB
MDFEADDSPAIRFVNMVLNRAIELMAEEFHLRFQDDAVLVEFQAGGALIDSASDPDVPWPEMVNRLKRIARMVDYGPSPSKEGRFRFRVSGEKMAEFLVTTNPNPSTDKTVVVKCLNVPDTGAGP